MKSLPLPVRVAAGLAVTAVEQARDLPGKLAGLPVTVVSQALQVSMRLQQQVTELAIKGDEVLSGLQPVADQPPWATFDEDLDSPADDSPAGTDPVATQDLGRNGHRPAAPAESAEPLDPWTLEERALAEETTQATTVAATSTPAGQENYDELSLPQLRARLRQFTLVELEELLAYERANANRPAFVGMLTRRIATVRDQQ